MSAYPDSKIPIICQKHGEFNQRISDHYGTKQTGCPKCSTESKAIKRSVSVHGVDYFINKANKTHNNKYSYNTKNFVNNKSKLTINCPIHGILGRE